jgi:hypothetical protein
VHVYRAHERWYIYINSVGALGAHFLLQFVARRRVDERKVLWAFVCSRRDCMRGAFAFRWLENWPGLMHRAAAALGARRARTCVCATQGAGFYYRGERGEVVWMLVYNVCAPAPLGQTFITHTIDLCFHFQLLQFIVLESNYYYLPSLILWPAVQDCWPLLWDATVIVSAAHTPRGTGYALL